MKKLSVVIPCFNEEKTLEHCVSRVLEIADKTLELEIIIVDDYSNDRSAEIAKNLAVSNNNIHYFKHEKNSGKGAALRTGFKHATGDYVAVQDADLEYDPQDLKRLLEPLIDERADVVLGSRFLSTGVHRVFYFWHYMGNKFLTLMSNMFTDLNLTDMETCYKVFRREIIQDIEIKEDRFGFEPEVVAEIAHRRLRIYEMGISYDGRTYAEGKKIGVKDGFRTLYCIFRYNAHRAPVPIQFLIYLFIGGSAAIVNLIAFLTLMNNGINSTGSILLAFSLAAAVNYYLCVKILFRSTVRWRRHSELLIFLSITACISFLDVVITQNLLANNFGLISAKLSSSAAGLMFNFMGRKYLVFPEQSSGDWR